MTSVVNQPTRRTSPARANGGRRRAVSPWVYVASVVVALATLSPVVYGVLSGCRTNGQLGADPVSLPNPWVFSNYVDVVVSGSFWQYALNSVIIAGVTTALVVVTGVMAAYPLARYRFRGRKALFNVFVAGLLFPLTVAIIPLSLMVRDLNLTNTYWGVALPQAAFALPMTIVILRPFLMALPAGCTSTYRAPSSVVSLIAALVSSPSRTALSMSMVTTTRSPSRRIVRTAPTRTPATVTWSPGDRPAAWRKSAR